MPNFQIKFSFEAEEPQELSVAEGEVVSAPAGSEASQEPWTLVETVVPPFNRGFVPTSFLVLMRTQPAGRSGPSSSKASAPPASSWENDSQHSMDSQPPPTQQQQARKQLQQTGSTGPASSKPASVRRLSDPRLAQQLLNVLAIHPPEEHVGGGARQSAANSHQGEYQHLLAQHDRQFQQVMHQRHAQFKALDETAQELARRAEGSKKKASEISTHLLDLTSIVEAERRKWKEKLNEQVNVYHA